MSEHPNVAVIDRMTQAVFVNDRDTLSELFTDDTTFHVRGPLPPRRPPRCRWLPRRHGRLFELITAT